MIEESASLYFIICEKCRDKYSCRRVDQNVLFERGWSMNLRAKKLVHLCPKCSSKLRLKSSPIKLKPSRSELREMRADELCREVRWQMANNQWDGNELAKRLDRWMRVAKKSCYDRPDPID